jgi:hypothetical protein
VICSGGMLGVGEGCDAVLTCCCVVDVLMLVMRPAPLAFHIHATVGWGVDAYAPCHKGHMMCTGT